jgi:hypothetical protein
MHAKANYDRSGDLRTVVPRYSGCDQGHATKIGDSGYKDLVPKEVIFGLGLMTTFSAPGKDVSQFVSQGAEGAEESRSRYRRRWYILILQTVSVCPLNVQTSTNDCVLGAP